jgi:hypothetical protein
MPARPLALMLAAIVASPALAQECPLNRAVYVERELGYEVHFAPLATRRTSGNVSAVFEIVRPGDDRNLLGQVAGNLGISRDVGVAQRDCRDWELTGIVLSDAERDACTYWDGLVYALADGGAEMLPFEDEAAPPAILLTDFGRQIRYSLGYGPADSPWDVFTFKACAQ